VFAVTVNRGGADAVSPKWDDVKQRSWSKDVTLENFAAWLETKNPRQRYDWDVSERCAVTQWLNDLGYEGYVRLESAQINGEKVLLPDEVFVANLLAAHSRTFGGLRKRLPQYLKRELKNNCTSRWPLCVWIE
jgi:hypothetical protein